AKQQLDIGGLMWANEYEDATKPGRTRVPLIDLPLTSQLKFAAAPATRFLDDHLPGVSTVVKEYLDWIGGLPRAVQPAEVRSPAWAALGHAIDFRLRLSLGCGLGRSVAAGVAAFGGGRAVRGAPASVAARDAVFRCGQELLSAVGRGGLTGGAADGVAGGPTGGPGPAPSADLARLCFVAAGYEDVYRSGEVRRGSMLASVTHVTRLGDLLRAVPDYAVGDIERQLALSAPVFGEFRALPRSAVTCGPVFEGSADIGGADADFVAGGLLLDCKATTEPRRLGADEIYQLAGYLLLDYEDEFGIRSVGLYLSRQGAVVRWDVPKFLSLLGARESLPDLRAGLRSYLREWRAHG
ncbi:MAG: ATP-dependent helicase, partial [Trebonia sp.]